MKVLLAVAALVLAAGAISLATRAPTPREQMRALRIELRALRDSAEACTLALTEEQDAFREYEARVDAMRHRIGALEALVPDGVPADSYAVYLAVVDSFNAAVPDWQPATDSLAAMRLTCEDRIAAHARLADSVRVIAESLGLLEESPPNPDR